MQLLDTMAMLPQFVQFRSAGNDEVFLSSLFRHICARGLLTHTVGQGEPDLSHVASLDWPRPIASFAVWRVQYVRGLGRKRCLEPRGSILHNLQRSKLDDGRSIYVLFRKISVAWLH